MADEPLKPQAASAGQPSWGQLARVHAVQYAVVLLLIVVLAASERWEPYHHVMYHGTTPDLELWRHSYPLRPNHVPAWAVPCVSLLTPLLCVSAFAAAGRINRLEAHHACLMVVTCVAFTGVLTNWIKVNVGRPRPHFVHRCWPHGMQPVFTPEGLPKCLDDAIDPAEGMKSFPSGHTSWSTAGLGFTTFWLLGQLRCFDGQAQPVRFIAALAPLLCAAWIGMSRFQDYWHGADDVAAGFVLGLLMAYCFYRQVYCSISSPHAGQLTAVVREGRASLSASPSRRSLLYLNGDAAGSEPPQQQLAGDEHV